MAMVYIKPCDTYQREQVEASVYQLLQGIPDLQQNIRPGMQVLLKVNLLSPVKPDKAVTTHPEVVRAVTKYILELGASVIVGDSSGGIIPGGSRTSRALDISGIRSVVEEVGGEVINFDATGAREIPNPRGSSYEPLYIAKPVLDADFVISMPKLKTHTLTVFTGAVKNMYGCIPGSRKAWYHQIAPGVIEFSEYIVDIFAVAKPQLAIMDGIVGMEGDGPSAGSPRLIGALVAGYDSVAVDAICASLIGLKPTNVPMLAVAAKRGLGAVTVREEEIVGPYHQLVIKDYKVRHKGWQPPAFIMQKALGWLQAYPVINRQNCIDCNLCFNSCPVKTIERTKLGLIVKPKGCIRCYCCHELCPAKAIDLKSSPLVDFVRTKYNARF